MDVHTKYRAAVLLAALACCAPAGALAQADPSLLPQLKPPPTSAPLTEPERRQERLATQLKLAELLEARDDLAGALKIWTELLAGEPRNTDYLEQASRLAMELQRHVTARELGRRLVRLRPQGLLGRTRLARALSETGLHAEALKHLRWAARRSPKDPVVRRLLARTLEATNSHAEAMVQLVWLGARGQADLEDHLARARLHRLLGQPKNERLMLRWLLPRVAGRSEEAEVRQDLADNLEAAGDVSGALAQYHWLVGQAPGDLERRLARLRLYGALTQPARVRAELAAVLSQGPAAMEKREVREGLAAAYELLQQPADALAQYDWLVAHRPQNVEYRLGRASSNGDLGRLRRQLRELVALARLAPRDPRVHRELGEYYLHRERFPLAERHYRTVLALAPRDPLALRRLAQMRRARERAARLRERQRRAQQQLQEWISDTEERAEDF